jgi:Tfp pilus assembly PilM family ATPase
MAHRILGIDIGAYNVKVVVVQAGLRQTTVVDVLEAPVPPGDEPVEERAMLALAGLVSRHGLEHDVPHFTIAGDALSVRVLDFPFQNAKRPDLERAVGGELEGLLPHDLEELVYDFDVIPREAPPLGNPVAEDAPTSPVAAAAPPPVRAMTAGTRVLAVASTRDRVRDLLALGSSRGLEPRSLIAVPTSFARVAERLGAGSGEPLLVVDCGHLRTDVCVTHRGRTVFARSLSRGGKQVTAAIARAWNLPWEQAENAKHTDGFVSSAREPAQSPQWLKISEVLTVELQPLLRELRQTLAACRAQTGVAPRRVLLCGGGGRLRGLASWLSEGLELPVLTVAELNMGTLLAPGLAERGVVLDHALPALGAALEAAAGRPAFDLRKGEFSYRADFSFLRQRAGYLAGAVLLVVAFAAGNAWAALGKLKAEEAMLDEQLRVATTEMFGQPVAAEEVELRINPKIEPSPLPKNTAFDLLVDLTKHIPPRDKAKLEVAELTIDNERITLKGTTDATGSIDLIEKGIKEVPCMAEIQRGKVTSGANDEKQFNLTISSKTCF